jgi:tripartite-type tricarboxylate transporter receptor subunit TctC
LVPSNGWSSRYRLVCSQITKIVVRFEPAGGTDVISRTLAQEMSKKIGGTVIVENKPGAGIIVGKEYVAKADPDGHTLVMATFAHAANPSLRAQEFHDSFKVLSSGPRPSVF